LVYQVAIYQTRRKWAFNCLYSSRYEVLSQSIDQKLPHKSITEQNFTGMSLLVM